MSRRNDHASLTRRQFVQRAALAGAALAGAPAFVSCKAPSEKLNLVIIGCGGRGAANLKPMLGENIVALCDVSEPNLLQAAEKAPCARQFRDFRKLYDELKDSEFDAVVVSSTEHTHAFATLPALQRKKHVYCEKPLTHSLREARLITEAAKKAGVATQMGTQIHAGNNYRRVVELIQGGAIGPVREAHVWVSRAWGRQSQEEAKEHKDMRLDRRTAEGSGAGAARPRLGPVDRPGTRAALQSGLRSGAAVVSLVGLRRRHHVRPGRRLARPAFLGAEARRAGGGAGRRSGPASGDRPGHHVGDLPVRPARRSAGGRVTWYQGTLKPDLLKEGKVPSWGNGVLFVGSRGMLLADYGKHVLLPEKEFADFKRPDKSIADSLGHYAEWLHACKTGAPTTCNFGYSGLLTEANHLGNVAYRAGKRIEWDAKAMRIPNAPGAEKYLGREYRKGWQLS